MQKYACIFFAEHHPERSLRGLSEADLMSLLTE